MFRQDLWWKSKRTLYFHFFLENRVVYKIMWKDVMEPDKPQMKMWHMDISCCIAKATSTLSESVAYCCSTGAVVARTRLNLTLQLRRTLPVLFIL
jgi:hypothetical protein